MKRRDKNPIAAESQGKAVPQAECNEDVTEVLPKQKKKENTEERHKVPWHGKYIKDL